MRLIEVTDHRSSVPIIPFYDLHWEDALCDRARAQRTVIEIAKRKAWTFLGGDVLACNFDHSVRSMTESRGERLAVEINSLCEMLEPIKELILCGFDGNHEDAGIKEADLSLIELICDRLGVPYCGESAVLSFHIGVNTGRKARHNPTIFATHGVGGGQTAGATINVVAKLQNQFIGADAYICGHTHSAAEASSYPWELVRQSKGPEGEYLRQREVILINAGSFQLNAVQEPLTEREKAKNWHPLLKGGFAAKKGFRPQKTGAPLIVLRSMAHGYSIIVPTKQVV
jgi:hypothetical protein